MQGYYWHGECAGCSSFGIECERDSEYSDDPNPCQSFTPIIDETDEYEEDYE